METKLIGIQFGVGDAYGRGLAEGVGRFLRVHPGYRGVLMSQSVESTEFWLRHPGMCGVLARIYHPEERDFCRWVEGHRLRVVLVSNTRERDHYPTVHADDVGVGALAARTFIGKGFRRLGFSTAGQGSVVSVRERWQGFSSEAAERGCECIRLDAWPEIAAYLAASPLPTGVLARNDHDGRTLLEQAMAAGIRVPHDLALIGVDNDPLESVLSPFDLSSIDLNLPAIGYAACELLTGEGSPESRQIVLPPQGMVERASTDTTAFQDESIRRAMRFIQTMAREAIDVADVARAAGVSRRVLERKFREQVGNGIRGEIVVARLDLALRLLEQDGNIADIAEACGFPDYRSFLREFRSRFGCTPVDYRRLRAKAGTKAHGPDV